MSAKPILFYQPEPLQRKKGETTESLFRSGKSHFQVCFSLPPQRQIPGPEFRLAENLLLSRALPYRFDKFQKIRHGGVFSCAKLTPFVLKTFRIPACSAYLCLLRPNRCVARRHDPNKGARITPICHRRAVDGPGFY